MKLSKLMLVLAILGLLVAGSVLAMAAGNSLQTPQENSLNKPCACGNQSKQGFLGKPKLHPSMGMFVEVTAEVTNMTIAEVHELCVELHQNNQTIIDYLKEQNLFETWKIAVLDAEQEHLNTLLDKGIISADEVEEKLSKLEEVLANEDFLARGLIFNDRFGNKHQQQELKLFFNTAAEITGLSPEELKELCLELKEDEMTLKDYLQQEGLFDDWKQLVLEQAEEHLASRIEEGNLTEDQAEKILENIEQRLDSDIPFPKPFQGPKKNNMSKKGPMHGRGKNKTS